MGGGHQDDCGSQLMQAGAFSGLAGGIVGSLQSSWTDKPMIKDQVTAHIRYAAGNIGRSAVVFAFTGATFSGASCFAASFRNKDDPWNAVIGGMAAGAVLGAHLRSGAVAFAAGALMAAVGGAVDYQSRSYPHLEDGRAVNLFKAMKQKSSSE